MAAIIFDLDGTIADSFDYVAEFIGRATGNWPLTPAQRESMMGMSMATMGRQLHVSWWRMPLLFHRGRRNMAKAMPHIKPFKELPEIIEKLHAEGHELFVVSSNSTRNVREFLHHHKLHKYFLEIYGGIGMFSKAPTLRKLMKENNFEPKDCIYVGDELRDIQASQAVNLRVISVTWGFGAIDKLKALKPTAVAKTPSELMAILEEV